MLELVAGRDCVAIVPSLGDAERHPSVTVRPLVGGPFTRTIFALSRSSDAARPSTAAVLSALGARS
jgi:DNA-binding transcriptional LysR family regulator